MQQLIKDATQLLATVEQSIEKHWQLVIDLRRVFNAEHDAKFDSLQQSYVKPQGKSGFLSHSRNLQQLLSHPIRPRGTI